MNANRILKINTFIFLLALLLNMIGCASPHSPSNGDQEGGITGTGNKINCANNNNRQHPLCNESSLNLM